MKRSGSSMKWLGKIFSNPRSRCPVAPAPDEAVGSLQEASRKAENALAWQPANGPLVEGPLVESSSPSRLRTAAADSAQPEVLPGPVSSSAALAQSIAVSAALVADGDSEDKAQVLGSYVQVCSREGKEPLPLELLDEPSGEVNSDLDVSLLPPLPVLDTQRHARDVPGSMGVLNGTEKEVETSSPRATLSSSDRSSELQARPRPTSFRGQASARSDDASSPKKGVFSLSSRPTTAGGETSISFPTSRQSSRAVAWNEQWTPGGQDLQLALKSSRQPRPPPLPSPVATPSASAADERNDFINRGIALTPLHEDSSGATSPSSGAQDLSAAAAKRANQRTTVQWATAPTNRSRWKAKKDDSQGSATPVASFAPPSRPTSSQGRPASREESRPASKELPSRPASRELAPGFSDLAVSFASLDDDM